MQFKKNKARKGFNCASVRTAPDFKYAILISCIFLLLLLVAYPMYMLVLKSLPLSNYRTQLSAPQTLLSLQNSLYIASGAAILAAAVGVPLAFLVTRTDILFKRLINTGVFLIFLTPGYIGTVAWIQLLGRSGYFTRWMQKHWGLLRSPIDIYTLEGVIVVMGLYFMPLIYMAACNALQNSDPQLEEAAIICGAAPFRAVLSVTLPLALPGILAGVLLVFIHGLSGFGIPAALAMPTGNMVLTTQIYAALGHYDVRKACATAVFLALMLIIVMALHNYLLRQNRHAVTAAPDLKRHTLNLGRWRYPLSALSAVLVALTALLPLITILSTSFLKAWGLPFSPENLTLGNYFSVFSVGLGARALRNSLLYALAGATCATMLGFIIAYISTRTKMRAAKAIDFLATLPSAIPGPVLAAAMIFAWMLPPLRLYNTPWIILAAYITAFLPYAVRNIAGALKSLQPGLEEMGWMCGGSWLTVLRDIVIPNVSSSIWTAWTLVFLMAFREIPLSTMLYTQGTETVGVLLFLLKTEAGGLEVTSAVSIIVITVTLAGQLLVRRLAGRVNIG